MFASRVTRVLSNRRGLPANTLLLSNAAAFYNSLFPRDRGLRIKDKFASRELMGERWKSKTLVPSQFGDEREHPDITLLVLRAWMVHRLLENGFADSRRCRRAVYERELARLQADIADRGGVENAKARACIAEWAPAALTA